MAYIIYAAAFIIVAIFMIALCKGADKADKHSERYGKK